MQKPAITIIIPSVKPLEDSDIIPSFLASGIKDRLFVQFVYLRNLRKPDDKKSGLESFETHEVLTVTNDRFFSTCEENLYRMQDVLGLLKPYIFCIGEHDAMDWAALEAALEYRQLLSIDVMGWNMLYKQAKPDGTYSSGLGLTEPQDAGHPAYPYVKAMFEGAVFDSSIAYPAMLSLYGPLDWAAFIGNHLYSLPAFTRLLQYTFREAMYSHVFKQAQMLTEYPLRYGFCNAPVIHRIADEFIGKMQGVEWWNPEARTVMGNTANIWVQLLLHMVELQNDALFDVMAMSVCLTQIPNETGDIALGRFAILNYGFAWMTDVVRRYAGHKSRYFPDLPCNRSLQDIRTCKLFLSKLLDAIEQRPRVYHFIPVAARLSLAESVFLLTRFFESVVPQDEDINRLGPKLVQLQSQLNDGALLLALNHASFLHYGTQKGARRAIAGY